MSDIDRLWEMQQHTSSYMTVKKSLKDLSAKDKIKRIDNQLKETERELTELGEKIKSSEDMLNKSNRLLKDYDYRLKKVEKSLYEENINDLKQLSLLDKERNDIIKDIEDKETEILLTMDEIERLRKEFHDLEKEFSRLKASYDKAVKEYRILLEDLNKKAEEEIREIKRIAAILDEDLYNKFRELINTKGIAVVQVVDNRCSGCNMVLPWVIIDKLKKKDEITYCENCHRMLYYDAD